MNTEIQKACPEDITSIITILKQNLIINKKSIKNDLLESQGFLICPYTEEEIRSFIADKEDYLVIITKSNSKVVGYAIGCNVNKMPELQLQLTLVPELGNSRIFYLKQIAKTLGVSGIGNTLMTAILNTAKEQGYHYIVSEIEHSPIKNKISKSFHEKFGFRLKYSLNEEKQTTGIYLKKL